MKSEPNVYSIDDLARDGTAEWEGVRNYQARNFMRDDMKIGDRVLYYHSNAKPPGVAGLARVVRESYPDFTAWDKNHKYYDPKTDPNQPRWMMVDLEFEDRFEDIVSLAELKEIPGLEDMMVIKKGMRLSIQPVTADQYKIIATLGCSKKAQPEPAKKKKSPAKKKKTSQKK